MPKPPPFGMEDEDEKTTIESGWEEEASTTVEQGEVADKIRALALGIEQARRPNTNTTSTDGGSMSDELTVDDQRAAAALAMLPPPRLARLVITQGNDSGQAIEVRPGKTYTIGRGIDNDLVLTDIAVSRKHFDIRNENGSWVLADRGSGNGTLVNHRIEDAPFMLASGDVIEIGNTAFRFDFPNGAPRTQSSYDVAVDDDLEPATTSGKPLSDSEVATPHQNIAPVIAPMIAPAIAPMVGPAIAPYTPQVSSPMSAPRSKAPSGAPIADPVSRPKTLPPPAPLPRTRTPSNRPPGGYALERPGPLSQSQPQPLPSLAAALAPTMSPMQGMQALPPPPQLATTFPPPQMLVHRPLLPPAPLVDPPLSSLPATIPGQGLPVQPPHVGQAGHLARLPFSYPSAAELPQSYAQNDSRRQMIIASGLPGRDATSTALVQPISYSNGQPMMVPQQAYSPPPQLSRRTKMVLGGAGLALIAAVATIAIVKGSSGEPDLPDVDVIEKAANPPPVQPVPPRPTVEPIRDPKITKAVVTPRIDKDKDKAVTPTPPNAPPVVTNKTDRVLTAAMSPPVTPTPTPPTPTPPTPVTPRTDKIATSPTPVTPRTDKIATPPTPPTPRADKIAATPTPPPPTPPAPPPPVTPRTDKHTDKHTDKRTDKHTDKKPTPPTVAHVEVARTDKVEVAPATPKTDKKHGGRSTQDVKNEANALYRTKRFSDAAAIVTAALPGFTGGDSQELKSIGAIYSQLGKAYNVGMAPGTKPTDAYVALRRAINYDRDVGSAYIAEIEHVLVTVASKAALSYAAAKEYESAFQAVRFAESLGSTSPTNKSVRDKLEELAGELYRSAAGEMTTDPDEAKKKLHQIQGMVDQKSALYGKATKLLNGS